MKASQKRAVANHRRRLGERGLARYEVRGLEKDKALLRKLASRLAKGDAESARLRIEVAKSVGEQPLIGRQIWEVLRRSPLVGADLNLEREVVPPREIDL